VRDLHGVGGPPRRPLRLQAAVAFLLAALFVVVYGATNWWTAQRPADEVRTWYFAWEPALVPYVPLLIVPYMSVDLLFFAAPFLCRDRRELRLLARRIVFAILAAAAMFLVLPLKLAWPARPVVGGWFGDFVEQSCTVPFLMEYPHNLFPALHVTFATLLVDHYGRHTRGVVRGLVYGWFGLIVASTVLTWQHHLVDVAGGLVLAGFAFYCYRESAARGVVVPNVRVGFYYAAGAAAVAALVPAVWPWGVFLVWPAAALGLTAAAYFGVGPGVFRKEQGRLPWSARFVLALVLLGHNLSWLHYRRQCRAWDEVAPGVHIGRALTNAEAAAAVKQGVTAVLDLTAELAEAAPFLAVRYCNLQILDLTAPTPGQLREAVEFIAAEAARGTVYVHCKAGYSRCAAVAGAYLLASGAAATVEQAVARLRQARPSIVVRPEALEALRTFAWGSPVVTPGHSAKQTA
jgi:protein-tyrosine phosphatase/membrane-associated phospholipid phosphatase